MGTYEHRLDTKARLVLPAKIREKLGDVVVAIPGYEKCVSLFSEAAWGSYVEKMEKLPFNTNQRARALKRFVFANAYEVPIDGTGRILLPQMLRDYAQLTQEVIIRGASDHVEVWNQEFLTVAEGEFGLENLSTLAEGLEGF
jgi:MraZ protein